MPSPTSSTRPTSSDLSLERYCSISAWRTETISSALNLMTASLNDLIPDRLELRAHRGVVEPIADPHDQAAKQLWIGPHAQERLTLEGVLELSTQAFPLVFGQGRRALHFDAHAAHSLVAQLLGRRQNAAKHVEPFVIAKHQQ